MLAEIGKTATINENGNVTWVNGFHIPQFQAAIRAKVAVIGPGKRELDEKEAWSIVNSAINSVIKSDGGKKPVEPCRLREEADKEAATFLKKGLKQYVLVTSLSVKEFPSERISLGKHDIRPLKSRRRYPLPKEARARGQLCGFSEHLKSTQYHLVRVSTKGRTIYGAANAALDALSYMRGLWNLFATYDQFTLFVGGPSKPLAAIHIGAVHTLHEPSGVLAGGGIFWYEPEYCGDQNLFVPTKGWAGLERLRRWAMRRISALPYEEELRKLLSRYVIALDSPNLSVASLHMWGLLEKMTDTIGANYDETVRRAVRVYDDRLIAKDMLDAVRLSRNQYVHAAQSGSEASRIAYIVKRFVDPHLLRLIRNDFGVESLQEYGQCLNMSPDLGTLKKQQKWVKKMIKMYKKK